MADLVHRIREAVVAIVSTNAAVLAAAGGSIRVVDRNTPGPAVTLPCVAYEVLGYQEATGLCRVLLTAVADAANAGEATREIAHAAAEALTAPAFAAHQLAIAPGPYTDENVNDVGPALDGAPNLRQTDRALVLRVLE